MPIERDEYNSANVRKAKDLVEEVTTLMVQKAAHPTQEDLLGVVHAQAPSFCLQRLAIGSIPPEYQSSFGFCSSSIHLPLKAAKPSAHANHIVFE